MSFEAIVPGTLFLFGLRDSVLVGLKTIEPESGHSGCAVLAHPELDGKPGYYYEGVVSEHSVLALSDAQFVLSPDPSAWALNDGRRHQSGDVLVAGERTMLCIERRQGNNFADLASGEIVSGSMETPMVTREWSVVQMMMGKPVLVFEHKAASRR